MTRFDVYYGLEPLRPGLVLTSDGSNVVWSDPPAPAIQHRGKCESCGSNEFKEFRGKTICSYCRSAA